MSLVAWFLAFRGQGLVQTGEARAREKSEPYEMVRVQGPTPRGQTSLAATGRKGVQEPPSEAEASAGSARVPGGAGVVFSAPPTPKDRVVIPSLNVLLPPSAPQHPASAKQHRERNTSVPLLLAGVAPPRRQMPDSSSSSSSGGASATTTSTATSAVCTSSAAAVALCACAAARHGRTGATWSAMRTTCDRTAQAAATGGRAGASGLQHPTGPAQVPSSSSVSPGPSSLGGGGGSGSGIPFLRLQTAVPAGGPRGHCSWGHAGCCAVPSLCALQGRASSYRGCQAGSTAGGGGRLPAAASCYSTHCAASTPGTAAASPSPPCTGTDAALHTFASGGGSGGGGETCTAAPAAPSEQQAARGSGAGGAPLVTWVYTREDCTVPAGQAASRHHVLDFTDRDSMAMAVFRPYIDRLRAWRADREPVGTIQVSVVDGRTGRALVHDFVGKCISDSSAGRKKAKTRHEFRLECEKVGG